MAHRIAKKRAEKRCGGESVGEEKYFRKQKAEGKYYFIFMKKKKSNWIIKFWVRKWKMLESYSFFASLPPLPHHTPLCHEDVRASLQKLYLIHVLQFIGKILQSDLSFDAFEWEILFYQLSLLSAVEFCAAFSGSTYQFSIRKLWAQIVVNIAASIASKILRDLRAAERCWGFSSERMNSAWMWRQLMLCAGWNCKHGWMEIEEIARMNVGGGKKFGVVAF
jgi:hypothetical protein